MVMVEGKDGLGKADRSPPVLIRVPENGPCIFIQRGRVASPLEERDRV